MKTLYRNWLSSAWAYPILTWVGMFFTVAALTAATSFFLPSWMTHGIWMFCMGHVSARTVPYVRWWRIRRYRKWFANQSGDSHNSPYRGGRFYTSEEHKEYMESRMP